MTNQPPKWISKFFRWFCRKDLVDGIEGDLIEIYQRRLQAGGKIYASTRFLLQVISFFQPFAFRKRSKKSQLTNMDMFKNYFKVGFRNLVRSKFYAAINIVGLAIGIAVFIVMAAYVKNETSYDKFNGKWDRIFRVEYQYEANGNSQEVVKTPFPLKPMFLNDYPEVEHVVRFYQNRLDATTLRYKESHFTEDNVLFADPEVFKVFDFELEEGNTENALADINSIVMTRAVAKKYFGEEDPMGKVIKYKNDDQLKVTGILKDVPETSHISFDILVPVELQRQRWIRGDGNNGYDFEKDWRWSGAWQYVLLKSPEAIGAFSEKLIENGKDFFGRSDLLEYDYSATPLSEIYLHSNKSGEFMANGNIRQVYGFAVIAVLILVIACINFINLNTARSAKRAKEVGLRKVMGAQRDQLIRQFIVESVLIVFCAVALATLLIEVMLPVFNQFMDKSLSIPYQEHPEIILIYFAGALTIGVFAGVYPAYYLSRFHPIRALKGKSATQGRGNIQMRKVLVTSQFVISNLLLVTIIIVQSQLEFIKGKDLGFNKDHVIVLKHGGKLDESFEVFSDRLKSTPYVVGTNLGYVAGTRDWTQSFTVEGQELEEAKRIGIKHVGFDFMKMFDLKLVEGNYFSKKWWRKSRNGILLNEKAVKAFGWTNEEAINKKMSYVGGSDNKTRFDCTVIGVLADAHLESLYEPIRPSVFKFSLWGDVSIKLNAGNNNELRNAISEVQKVWDEISPEWPFEYEFLDEVIAEQYLKEERLGQTIKYFTFLVVFVACLGLFGLASFTIEERTKEIGVRKVLGASVGAILVLVSRGFFKMVVLSFLISIPLGIYFGQAWLQEFEYRIEITPLVFVISGILSIVIAALAVGGQSLKAAVSNPVKTLRYE